MKLTKKVLYHSAKPVDFKWPFQNQKTQQDMFDLMVKENGIGLAATQIGLAKRLFVMSVDGKHRACFNPEILESSDLLVEFDEGCLSFPGESCKIKRPQSIVARYQDANGDWTTVALDGLEARCYQHELDHLDGITMWQRHKEQNAE